MRIAIVDDQESERKHLRDMLDAYGAERNVPLELHEFSLSINFIEDYTRPFDIIFMDIEMPGMNGLMLALEIKKVAPNARIVFTSGYDRYALEAYRIHAQGYLMKPIDAAAIREEVDQIPLSQAPKPQKLYIQCFGPFEVFWQGEPLPFRRRKTKELLAFLVDRKGVACTSEEIVAALWEDETDLRKAKHQIRNLIGDLRTTMKEIAMEDLLIRRSGELAIRADEIECDYYQMLSGDPAALNAYHGEYMKQYSWAEITSGKLWFEYHE